MINIFTKINGRYNYKENSYHSPYIRKINSKPVTIVQQDVSANDTESKPKIYYTFRSLTIFRIF